MNSRSRLNRQQLRSLQWRLWNAALIVFHSSLLPRTRVQNGARHPPRSVLREGDLSVISAVDVERRVRRGNNCDGLARFELEDLPSADSLDHQLAVLDADLQNGLDRLAYNCDVERRCLVLALDLQLSGTTQGPPQSADHLTNCETR